MFIVGLTNNLIIEVFGAQQVVNVFLNIPEECLFLIQVQELHTAILLVLRLDGVVNGLFMVKKGISEEKEDV